LWSVSSSSSNIFYFSIFNIYSIIFERSKSMGNLANNLNLQFPLIFCRVYFCHFLFSFYVSSALQIEFICPSQIFLSRRTVALNRFNLHLLSNSVECKISPKLFECKVRVANTIILNLISNLKYTKTFNIKSIIRKIRATQFKILSLQNANYLQVGNVLKILYYRKANFFNWNKKLYYQQPLRILGQEIKF
jgi:hypothetical protein